MLSQHTETHLQESSYSCSHNHWFSICTALVACSVCCHNCVLCMLSQHTETHLQESSYSCSHNHWFSICTALVACSVCCHNTQSTQPERYRYWTNGYVNSCTSCPEDGPVGPKHVETQQCTNKIVTSVGFHSICWKDARYKKLKIYYFLLCRYRLSHFPSLFTSPFLPTWFELSGSRCYSHYYDGVQHCQFVWTLLPASFNPKSHLLWSQYAFTGWSVSGCCIRK